MNAPAWVGAAIVLLFLALAVAAPAFAPYDPYDQDFASTLAQPGGEHPFGTDEYGRDMLSRVMYGTRSALVAVVVAVGLSLVMGSALGLVAGFFRGWVDGVVVRLVDILLAFPFLLLALIIVAALGPGLANALIALGVVHTPRYARLMRGQVLVAREADYVSAAQAVGAGWGRIMLRHVLPNVSSPIVVLATLQSGAVVVETASLSFLGLGAQPPSPDWGALLAEGQSYFLSSWWIATFPGVAIFVVVLGFNLLGDALRQHVDPRRRAQIG